MKILHFDEMFHPSFGYQINVLTKFQALQGHEVIILTSDHPENHPKFKGLVDCDVPQMDAEFTKKYGVKIIRWPIYRVVSGMVLYKPGFIKKIKEINPDVLMCHTHDTICGMLTTWRYKYLNMPIVFDNHMLAISSRSPLHKPFCMTMRLTVTPLMKKNKWTVIRTQDDPYVYDAYGIPLDQAPFISFGSDTTIFHRDENVRKEFRSKCEIPENDFVIVYTGKLDDAKGGKLLAEACRKRFKTNRGVTFVVVGTARSEYEQEVEKIFSESENRIIRFGTQKYVDLPRFYQIGDLFLCPKQCSLSFYDAEACGLPVVAEDNNVNVERVSHENGAVFKADDVEDFRKKIENYINMDPIEYTKESTNAEAFVLREYDYATISKQYTKIMEAEVVKFQQARKK